MDAVGIESCEISDANAVGGTLVQYRDQVRSSRSSLLWGPNSERAHSHRLERDRLPGVTAPSSSWENACSPLKSHRRSRASGIDASLCSAVLITAEAEQPKSYFCGEDRTLLTPSFEIGEIPKRGDIVQHFVRESFDRTRCLDRAVINTIYSG